MAALEVLAQGVSFVVIIKIPNSYWALTMCQALCWALNMRCVYITYEVLSIFYSEGTKALKS